jgi:FAD/FMN-containing dehydrogenase
MTDVIERLVEAIGADSIVTGDLLRERATSYWDPSPTRAKALVRPRSTGEVSRVMQICHDLDQSVVVQGGLTGVVSGAVSSEDDVIISMERMNAIEDVDELDAVAVVQAGAVLQNVQEALADQGFLFPLDFGARGSCMIGGCVATNAGGINVLRYGMTRQNLLGVEAVLADGTIVSSMNQMLKNNTGYDLKQLFVGSEGTLGIVTRAVFKLFPLPTSRQTAMLATNSFDAVTRLLRTMHCDLAGTLSAFEVMWDRYVTGVTKSGGHVSPFDQEYPFYILAEAEGSDAAADQQRFEAVLERGFEAGDIADAVIPKSDSERTTLWNIREEFDPLLPAYLYDVSMPMKAMVPYVERIEECLRGWRDDAECYVFGHVADGNLHIFVTPYDDGAHHEECDRIVYESLEGLSGSISAEHGIGIDKREWLGKSRSAEEIRIMRQIKATLDPKSLLNPGRVI